MVTARLATALLLTASSSGVRALSALRDLDAQPAFAVRVVGEHPVLNDTVADLLNEPLETPPHSLAPKRHVLRSPNGQAFLCTVPAVTDEASRKADEQAEEDALARAEERERGVQHGLALLEPMKQGCLFQRQGWFTYSFCYGREIRQYHEIRVAGSVGPSEDPHADSYTLGVAPETAALTAGPKYGSGSPELAKSDSYIPSKLGGGDGAGWDEGGKYLVQTWSDGTICDKTGTPRMVEVQYHCSTQTLDRIALIRETSICRYVLLIHTPRLCSEPLFIEGQLKQQAPAATIECQPVVKKFREQLPETVDPAPPAPAPPAEPHVVGEYPEIQQVVIPAPPQPASPPQPDSPAPPPPPSNDQLDSASSFSDTAEEGYDDDLGMVTLVYDPETGEIASAVTDSGEDVFLNSELRKELFGESFAKDGKDDEGVKQEDEEERRKNEETVKTLEGMVKQMQADLAAAIRGINDPAAPQQQQQQQPGVHLTADDSPISTLLKALLEGQADGEQSDQRPLKMQPGLNEYLKGFEKEKKAVQVPRQAVVGSEEYEKMRSGFAKKYDEEEEREEKKGVARDEL
ncbi:hypothetical protein JCM8547_007330 [Rhodosporidiobolus lusitaniae]